MINSEGYVTFSNAFVFIFRVLTDYLQSPLFNWQLPIEFHPKSIGLSKENFMQVYNKYVQYST
jgi:hypothetical protein